MPPMALAIGLFVMKSLADCHRFLIVCTTPRMTLRAALNGAVRIDLIPDQMKLMRFFAP